MLTRDYWFEELGPNQDITIRLTLEFGFYYQAAKLNGRPEDCYPEELDWEINLPDHLDLIVAGQMLTASPEEVASVVTQIESLVYEMNHTPELAKEWYDEEEDDDY